MDDFLSVFVLLLKLDRVDHADGMLASGHVSLARQLIRAENDLGAAALKILNLVKANVKASVIAVSAVNTVGGDHGMAEAVDQKRNDQIQRNQPADQPNQQAGDQADQGDQEQKKAQNVKGKQKQQYDQNSAKHVRKADL